MLVPGDISSFRVYGDVDVDEDEELEDEDEGWWWLGAQGLEQEMASETKFLCQLCHCLLPCGLPLL